MPVRRSRTVLQMSEATLTVGSMILTDQGERPVEDLQPGQLVFTKNLGLQKLRYVALQDVDLTGSPQLSPIKINAGRFGIEKESFFHPSQHIEVRHPLFDMMFGSSEVLLRCGELLDQPGFSQISDLTSLTYVALGFSHHHVVICNGAPVDVGPTNRMTSRISLGPKETRLAIQLLSPRVPSPKRHSFPLH